MTAATAPTNIADLKNAPAVRTQNVVAGFNDLHSFELMQRIAKMLASSSLVPQEFRGADGMANCIIALNMAQRMSADPLMVMQSLYLVHGRPSWSAQFLIATFNRNGRYTSIRYKWQGSEGKDDWGCRAYATEIATGNEIVGPLVTIGLAKAEGWFQRTGSKWKTIPELMLTYRAAAWMVRTNAPEIAMGLPTADELDDVVTLTSDQYRVEQVAAGEHAKPNGNGDASNGAAKPEPDKTTGESVAAFTYAVVEAAIAESKDGDTFNLAVDMIRGVADAGQQKELTAIAAKRRESIEAQARA